MAPGENQTAKKRERVSNYPLVADILEWEAEVEEPRDEVSLVREANVVVWTVTGEESRQGRGSSVLENEIEFEEEDSFWNVLQMLDVLDADVFPDEVFAKKVKRTDAVGERFEDLSETWKTDTAHLSSIVDIAMHPAYQQIIGMGNVVIPYILNDLAKRPDHWFWALKAITGEDPIKPENRGNLQEMKEDWLNWGRERGYL